MCVRSGWWSFKIHDNFMCKFKTKKVGFRKSWVGWEREGGPSPLLITLLLRACITEKLSSMTFLRTQPPYGGFIFNRYAKNFSSVSLFHTCTRTPSLWFIFTYALKPFLPDTNTSTNNVVCCFYFKVPRAVPSSPSSLSTQLFYLVATPNFYVL